MKSRILFHRVDPPVEGWCQTVPNEGNHRLVLRLNPPIRISLEARAMSRDKSAG